MKHQKHQENAVSDETSNPSAEPWIFDFEKWWPYDTYPTMHHNQSEAFKLIRSVLRKEGVGKTILELPTGSGKTVIGIVYLLTLHHKMQEGEIPTAPLFYIVPNKALVKQVCEMFPDITFGVYGRNEYDCLYYQPKETFTADQIPCLVLPCKHRVNQDDGTTQESGAEPCPYYLVKYKAKQLTQKARIIVCTASFYLFTQLIHEWPLPGGLVIDETDELAEIFRRALSTKVSDWHLSQCVTMMRQSGMDGEADLMQKFYDAVVRIVGVKSPQKPTLLKKHEISELLEVVPQFDTRKLKRRINALIKDGKIDAENSREVLNQLTVVANDLKRYAVSLAYALPEGDRRALNYLYAYYEGPDDLPGKKKVRCVINICNWYMPPLIRRILSPRTLAYTATIGEYSDFAYDTGIEGSFYTMNSDFPVENSRIFMPDDVANLAVKSVKPGDKDRMMRLIAKSAREFADQGHRSLVVVISNEERSRFLEIVEEYSLKMLTYGNGVSAREAIARFQAGEGEVFVGTAANCSHGLNFDKQTAPVIFFLRPGYPVQGDPLADFEEERMGNKRWGVWTWRVMRQLLQVRGRNIRSPEDLGVIFLMSGQFKRFAGKAIPGWLIKAYISGKKFRACVSEAKKLLKKS